jgi:multiple sugar transport system permease protein
VPNTDSPTPAAPKKALTDRAVANLFLLPTILLLVAMNIFPLFWSLGLSFTKFKANANKPAEWIGNANYTEMMSREQVWQSFTTTAAFVLLAVGLQLAVGFGLAILLNRSFKLKGIVTTLFLLPMMLSSVVVGLFWRFLLDTNFGMINWLLGSVGLMDPKKPINWTDKDHALWSVVIADTWQWAPFVMLIALAGLASVPKTLYEAASVDRASEWFRFRFITMPFITPLLLIALLFRTLDSFKMFDLAWIMTERGATVETVSIQVFREALRNWNTGKACALAYIVLLVIIGLTNLYLMMMARVRGEAKLDAAPLFAPDTPWLVGLQKVAPASLGILLVWGAFKAGGALFVMGLAVLGGLIAGTFYLPKKVRSILATIGIAIALFAYLFPLGWMIATSLKQYTDVNAMPPKFAFTPTGANYAAIFTTADGKKFMGQMGNSLLVSVISTVIAVFMGTLAAYTFSRFKIKAKGDALFFILSTRMLPPVVVLVPVYLMYQLIEQKTGIKLLNTLFGLGLLYTTVGVAFATWLMKGFTDDVPPEYEEAALLDRYSRLRAMQKTVLPLVIPGMATTAVFVFLNAWNEYAFGYFLSGLEPLTAPPSITAVIGGGSIPWNEVAARAMVFLLPAAIFTFLMRNHLLRGMTFGAIKGR